MITVQSKKGKSLKVNDSQNSILIGSILGDAYIDKKGKIQIEHCLRQKDYVDWKYKTLESISYGRPKIVTRYNKKSDKTYKSSRFWTRQYFWKWRERFYQNNKKIFPDNLTDKELNPLAIAVWYMDDGYYTSGEVLIATNCFSYDDLNKIVNFFRRYYDITVSIRNKSRIYIYKSSWHKFFNLISPFILDCFKYKLP